MCIRDSGSAARAWRKLVSRHGGCGDAEPGYHQPLQGRVPVSYTHLHVNDAGFWLFGKFTGASEAQPLKTWTMMETILGTTGAIVGMIAFQLLS